MEHSLRKGSSYVDLEYSGICDSIRADTFGARIDENTITLSLRLRPTGRNQEEDERNLHKRDLTSVSITDNLIIRNLERFVENSQCDRMTVKIASMGKVLAFQVNPQGSDSRRLFLSVYH